MNTSEPLGRRERNKMRKRERIVSSAHALFRLQGYDQTTTREIAEAADVAAGTLFGYARDKRDIILMIINDELEAAFAAARPVDATKPLEDQLTQLFQPYYDYFARERAIALVGLREISSILRPTADDSAEVRRLHERHVRGQESVAEIVQATFGSDGAVLPADWLDLALEIILCVQNENVRSWLQDESSPPEVGLDRLRKKLAMVIKGIDPKLTDRMCEVR